MKKNSPFRNVLFLGITSFFTDFSTELIYPFLPLFFSTTLGLSRTFIGLIEGVAESLGALLRPLSGWLSDRWQRKGLVISGYTLSNFTKPLFSFVRTGPQALLVRIIDRCGKGIRTPPRDALISLTVPDKGRGRFFGIHRSLDTLGAVAGPLAAFFLLPALKYNLRALFLFSFIPGSLAILVLILGVKDTREKRRKVVTSSVRTISPSFWYFLLIIFFFSLGNSSDAFIILRAKSVGILLREIPILWLLFNLTYSLFSIPGGILADRWGRKRVIGLSFLLYSLIYIGFARISTGKTFWFLMFAYGLFYGLNDGNLRAWVGEMVGRERVGTAYGVYHSVNGTTLFLSSLIMGLLWDRVGVSSAFLFGSTMGGISFLLLLLGFKL